MWQHHRPDGVRETGPADSGPRSGAAEHALNTRDVSRQLCGARRRLVQGERRGRAPPPTTPNLHPLVSHPVSPPPHATNSAANSATNESRSSLHLTIKVVTPVARRRFVSLLRRLMRRMLHRNLFGASYTTV